MARAEDVLSLEEACPWLREDFQADLALLADGTGAAARLHAADMRVLARLSAQVPRCPFDETGATPWTSFRREVALARKVSDRTAGQLIRAAWRLTTVLPQALGLLEAGVLTVTRAAAFVTELEDVSDELAGQVDAELADKVALLPVWRIEQEVRKAVLRLDPDAAAERTARKNADRGVSFHPDTDDQAGAFLSGPAVPLHRWYATLDQRARALKAAGDLRTLDALRFDLATSTYPCDVYVPADPTGQPTVPAAPTAPAAPAAPEPVVPEAADAPAVATGLRPSGVEAAPSDCRMSRPVQAHIIVPVETALGLSNEPAWLEGYGWISAPTSRELLVDAELRRVCAQSSTGLLVDLAERGLRPPPTPSGIRDALLSMVLDDIELDDLGWRTEPQHDPTDRLREYVTLRDRTCDGPTGARVNAARADLDHDTPYPHGPTAAWNLAARGQRTHHLKHYGWTPLRTPTGTVWISPAGQIVETLRHADRPPGIDPDPSGRPPQLPEPDELHHLDRQQLTPPCDDTPPCLPTSERDSTDWTWLTAEEPAPF